MYREKVAFPVLWYSLDAETEEVVRLDKARFLVKVYGEQLV